MSGPVARDERTLVVENAGYRLAYQVTAFALLIDVAYRAYALKQSSWDLLLLVVAGGLVTTIYQGVNRVLSRRWAIVTVLTMLAAAAVGAMIVLLGLR